MLVIQDTGHLNTRFIWIQDSMGVWYSNGKVTWLGGPFKYRTFWTINTLFSVRFSDHLLNTRPFENRTQIYHSNTRLVWYSDGYCVNVWHVCHSDSKCLVCWNSLGMSYIKALLVEGWHYSQLFLLDWHPKDFPSLSRTGVAVGNAMVDLDYIASSHNIISNKSTNRVSHFSCFTVGIFSYVHSHEKRYVLSL